MYSIVFQAVDRQKKPPQNFLRGHRIKSNSAVETKRQIVNGSRQRIFICSIDRFYGIVFLAALFPMNLELVPIIRAKFVRLRILQIPLEDQAIRKCLVCLKLIRDESNQRQCKTITVFRRRYTPLRVPFIIICLDRDIISHGIDWSFGVDIEAFFERKTSEICIFKRTDRIADDDLLSLGAAEVRRIRDIFAFYRNR